MVQILYWSCFRRLGSFLDSRAITSPSHGGDPEFESQRAIRFFGIFNCFSPLIMKIGILQNLNMVRNLIHITIL
jgi:hypothetical protein